MTVSLEWFLLQNISVNIPILWASLRLCGVRVNMGRVFAASALGAVYGAVAFASDFALLRSWGAQAIAAAAMALTAHNLRDWRTCGRIGFFVWVMTFFFGGAGLSVFTTLGARGVPFSPWMLALAFPCAAVAVYAALRLKTPAPDELTAEVTFRGKTARLRALRDTGNRLIEPISGLPVMLLSPEAANELGLSAQITPEEAAAVKLRMVPYHSVGNASGVLAAVRPDRVVLRARRAVKKEMYIAASPTPLHQNGGFQAILPP